MMNKELVINTTSHETRVALLEGGHIAELYIERERERGIVGNIYKGRVIRVLPGMQAAFVEIDPAVVRLARKWFDLDALGVEVTVADAREVIARSRRRFDAVIETAVRDCPEQWFWVHRRWRLPRELQP